MLTAFKIIRNDGSSYITNMAAGVTLEQATQYFKGQTQYTRTTSDGDEDMSSAVKVTGVEQGKE